MADRVHAFGGSPLLLQSRHILRVMARCITGDTDVTPEEGYAQTLDAKFGGDEASVGAAMAHLLEHSSDPREYTERVIAACDLLRQARRTAH